jgi:RimJ/RimL family protein N-acetyltransferase
MEGTPGSGLAAAETIDGHGVRLRRFRADDAEDIVAACNDPLAQRFVLALPRPYTPQDAQWWIAEGSPQAFTTGGAALAIADPATGRLLGAVGVTTPAETPGRGEIGYWVAPWARGRGAATAACVALTEAAFADGYVRLRLLTDPENGPSQRVAIAAGYWREGLLREAATDRDGRRWDMVQWARLASDPPGPSRRLLPDVPRTGLTDGVVRLRPLGRADIGDTYGLRSLPDVVATSVPPRRPEPAEVAHICAHAESQWLAGMRASLTIRDAASDAYAGEIGLYFNEPDVSQAMIGYCMVTAWRRKGYATRAVRLLSAWAFEQVGLVRLVAGVAPDNVGSQKVLTGAGFQQEGYQPARQPGPDGTRVDNLLFGLVNR